MEKIIIGIDPGATGSMATIFLKNNIVQQINFYDFKTNGIIGYINFLKTVKQLPEYSIVQIGLEKVHAMPKQGVKSVFSFGQRLGELEGMLITLKLGYIMPRPQDWQRECGVKPKSGKKGIYSVISKIYPDADLLGPKGGIIDGRCDALGIAHYLRGKYN